jgi:hypothetical protein
MAKEATPVKDGDVVSIVPSIAGGSDGRQGKIFTDKAGSDGNKN